jgi:hypothetical protein
MFLIGLNPDSIGTLNLDPDSESGSGQARMTPKKGENKKPYGFENSSEGWRHLLELGRPLLGFLDPKCVLSVFFSLQVLLRKKPDPDSEKCLGPERLTRSKF